jgi:putative aldouronate transport system substrate-binding protein
MMKTKVMTVVFLLISVLLFAGGQNQGRAGTSIAQSGLTDIELWYLGTYSEYGPPPADWKVVQIIKDELGINLILGGLPSDTNDQNTKINAAAAANVLPDIFRVTREVLVKIQPLGVVAQVDDLYPLMPIRTQKYHGPDSRAFTTINGKSYGLALPGQPPNNEGVLIRKDWLDKLKLPVPVTTEEYFNVMKAFTLNDPDGNGRQDTFGYGAFIEINEVSEGLGRRLDPFMGAFGVAGTWNLTKAKAGLNVRKPEYYEALAYIKSIIDAKIIDPNWTSYKKDDYRAAWKQGRFGIMREQWNAYGSVSNYLPFDQNFPQGEWIVIDPPKGPKEDLSVGACSQPYLIHSVSTKAMQAGKGPVIAKLLEWMSSDEGYYLLTYGEEGVNYLLDKDGLPTLEGLPDPSKGFTSPATIPILQLSSVVSYGSLEGLKVVSPDYITANSKKPMSPFTVLNNMLKRPWTFTSGADTLPLPDTDLKRFYEQGVVEFVTGNRVLNQTNWTTWVAEFDQLGGAAWEKAGVEAAQASGFLK